MRLPALFLLAFLAMPALLFAQKKPGATDISTTGDNSPAVIAEKFSSVYGVRADAIEAILKIYEKEGLDPATRKRRTEALLDKYQHAPEKTARAASLSEATKSKIGLEKTPGLSNALDWDLFATKNYLSLQTSGTNSPAIHAPGGEVNIWYGIPPAALRALAGLLEENKVALTDFETRLEGQVKKYEDLKAELNTYGASDPLMQQAEKLLEAGKLKEVEQLLDSTLEIEDKRLAYRHHVDGKAKALLLKYDAAAMHYRKAAALEPENSKYLLSYAFNENTRAHYDEAIVYYQKALAIDTVLFKDQPEKAALLFNNLGSAWQAKGEYDRTIAFYEKALPIFIQSFGEKHPNVAVQYNNLGLAWQAKGEYDRAIAFFEKTLAIDSIAFGSKHPDVAIDFNNLGSAWQAKGEYDRAIAFFEKALLIFIQSFGEKHPNVAVQYNNLGSAWQAKGEYDRAIAFYEKALAIDSIAFGNKHPNVATRFNNLGSVWQAKGEYDRAIAFYEKALAIDSIAFGSKHPNVATRFNNLGSVWKAKGEYDRAIAFYEKALAIDSIAFGSKHPNVATRFNNLGSAWDSKGEYDRAIAFYEKALAIDSIAFGSKHPKVATRFNNLGGAWQAKGEYDRAIAFYEKALAIDSIAFGNKHPDVAIDFNNLGSAWKAKGEYDRAIAFYEKALAIFIQYLGREHPSTKTVAQNLSLAANSRGMELFQKQQYAAALPYFQKALQNAEAAEDWDFSLTCLSNIGSMHKRLEQHAEGLAALDKGLERAEHLNKGIDEQLKEVPVEKLKLPEVQAKIAEFKNLSLIRRMRYHRLGCLAGLGRKKEAEALVPALYQEALDAQDARTVEDLKNDGWTKNKD